MLGPLREVVAAYAAEHGLFAPGDRVLLGCSGGVDSLAALGLLGHERFGLDIVVGHVDHGIRPESAADGAHVARIAEQLGLLAVSESLELGVGGPVSEARARKERLAALERLADAYGAGDIVLAHTASDQLETLVMRLVRGAGLQGLAGIPPRRGRLVRPLLPLTRADTCAVVQALGWQARQDTSNSEPTYFRNRVRHDIVPLLERENPAVHRQAFRTAEVLRQELVSLRALQRERWQAWLEPVFGGWRVDRRRWQGADPATRADCVRWVWGRLRLARARSELTFAHVRRAARAGVSSGGPSRLDLPAGVVLIVTRDWVYLQRQAVLADPGDVTVALPGPGLFPVPALGWRVGIFGSQVPEAGGGGQMLRAKARAWLRVPPGIPEGQWPLELRNARAGERVGEPGREARVVDWLARGGIPGFARRRWPLLAWRGQVVWIPGCWADSARVALSGPGGGHHEARLGPGAPSGWETGDEPARAQVPREGKWVCVQVNSEWGSEEAGGSEGVVRGQ